MSPVTTGEAVIICVYDLRHLILSYTLVVVVLHPNVPEFKFMKHQIPQISPPGVISDVDEPPDIVSRLISPVKGDDFITGENFVTGEVTITAITGDTVTAAISGSNLSSKGVKKVAKVQSGAVYQSQGFADHVLGSSHG